jgi:tetratricopeptide (TPR) repeat protein
LVESVVVSLPASIEKALEALAKSDSTTARATLEEAKASWPNDADVLMLEARVVEAESSLVAARPHYQAAATALKAALKDKPSGYRATALANALCNSGELDAARSALVEAARLGTPKLHVLRAERAIAFAGDDLSARRRAAEAVVGADDQADVWDWVRLAIACRDLVDKGAAAAAAARALEHDPRNAQAARIASWAANDQSLGEASRKAPPDTKTPSAVSRERAEWIAKTQQALARQDVSGARVALDAAKLSWPDDPDVLWFEARVVESEGATIPAKSLYRKAADALSASLKQTPDGNRAVALSNALCKCGDLDGAQAALAEATRLGARRSNILRAERSLAFAREDLPVMRRAAEAIVETGDRVDAWDWVNLAIARRNLDDMEGATAAAARALELDPVNTQAARISAGVAVLQGNIERAVRELRRVAAISPNDPTLAFHLARALSFSGRPVEAADEIGRALERWPNNWSIRAFALASGYRTVDQITENEAGRDPLEIDCFREMEIRRLARILPSDGALLRPPIVDDVSKDVVVGQADRSDKLVLVFTAQNDAVNMPIAMFDRYLAKLGVSAIFLKDFNRLLHVNGVVSLGDSLESTLSTLRGLITRMGARRIYCIGASAGGFAAIRYGAELGVERVVSFAGETFDPQRARSKLEPGLTHIRRKLEGRFSSEQTDLRQFLVSRRPATRFELFYPADAPRDAEQAKHLEGMEGVTLHPIAGCDVHELMLWMALREDLGARLASLLDI